jgi:trk system potassium uptake protein TrkA
VWAGAAVGGYEKSIYNRKMRIVIVGAGRTGTQLARHLIQEKHDVSLIESNEERARHASNRLDCLVLHDEGNSLASLEEAGAGKADALVCVTDSDEVNMIICGLAASRYPHLRKIARVRNDDYVRLNRHAPAREGGLAEGAPFGEQGILGIDYFVHPDVEAARAALRALSHGALGNILDFAGSSYELGSIEVAAGSAFDGLAIKDYRSLIKEESLVTLVEREEGASGECILPGGSTVLRKGDRIHILAQEAQMEHIFRLAGRYEKPLRRVGIVGGGRVGVLIAEGLLGKEGENGTEGEKKRSGFFSFLTSFIPKSSRRVVIVEQNYDVCKDLAARFPEALVLNEDISDESFVAEEHLGDLDLIITATANQELNMIAAIYCKSRGVRRAIALVSGSGYEAIARRLGVDVVIPMQSVVADSILSNLMGGGIRGVHRLGDGSLGIIEVTISGDSPAADLAITEFRLSGGGLIMLVNRGESSFIPRGDYVFRAADKVILIAKNGSEAELEKFFGGGE